MLLVVLAVTVVTGRGGPAETGTPDSIVAMMDADGEEMDALGVELVAVLLPLTYHLIPPVLHGTEAEHASPELARVFRPPRGSFA